MFDPKLIKETGDFFGIRQFFMENYSKIRCKKYNGEDFTDIECAVFVLQYLSKTDDKIKQFINALDYDQTPQGKIYAFFTNDNGTCKNGKMMPYVNGFKFCGSHCPCAVEFRAQHRRNKSPEEKAAIQERAKQTTKERFGTEHNMHSERSKQRMRATNLQRYGHACSLLNEEVNAKARKTNVKRHGGEYSYQSPTLYEKAKHTTIERYGVEHFSQTPEQRTKMRNNADAFQEKAKVTKIRNGTYNQPPKRSNGLTPNQQALNEDAKRTLFNRNAFVKFMVSRSINRAALDLHVDRKTISKYCVIYNVSIEYSRSTYERELTAILDEWGITYKSNDRGIIAPMEIDLLVESHRLAIEFDGLYWHSEDKVGRSYHRNKHQAITDQGYRLFSIREDEWLHKQPIVLSRLANILGMSEKGIGARKVTVAPITRSVANAFFDKYHIQGATQVISHAYGAFYNDELIAAMAFGCRRGISVIELTRFVTDGRNHAGIFSKLFHTARKLNEWDEIVSFADLRHSAGNVYEKNGFLLENIIGPDYIYCKGTQTFHKSNFTKAKIAQKFGIDMSQKTERSAMAELGFWRYYDAGKAKYVYRTKNLSFR